MKDALSDREILKRITRIRLDNRSGSVELTKKAAVILQLFSRRFGHARFSEFSLQLQRVSRALADAQPMMAGIFNLTNSVLKELEDNRGRQDYQKTVQNVSREFVRKLDLSADQIFHHALRHTRKGSVIVTHSYSSTVLHILVRAHKEGRRFEVVCTESRPMFEGVALAKKLGEHGISTTLMADAAIFSAIPRASFVLLGADAVTSDGVVNKIGTLGITVVANSYAIPTYVLCGTEKFLPSAHRLEAEPSKRSDELQAPGLANVRVRNVYFDVSPLERITKFISEAGERTPSQVRRTIKTLSIHPSLH